MQEQIKFIVEYQEIDKNLKAIEDQINGSEEAKKYITAKKFLSTVKDSLVELDAKAQKLTAIYTSSVSDLEKLILEVKNYEKTIESCQDENELVYLKKKFQESTDKVSKLSQKIDDIIKEMTELNKEFIKLGQANRAMRTQYDESRVKIEELKSAKNEEVQQLKKQLDKIKEKIDATLMEKYSVRRKDKKFPVVFGLDLTKKSNYCPFCATSMPSIFIEALSLGEIKECESCHRLIYGYEPTKAKK